MTKHDPFRAWEDARAQADSIDSVERQLAALTAILEDLEEHGDDNLDDYGGGEYSADDFVEFRDAAVKRLARLHRARSAVPLPPAGTSKATIELSDARTIPGGGGNWPERAGERYVSIHQDGEVEALCLRGLDDPDAVVPLRVAGDPIAARSVAATATSPDGRWVAIGLWRPQLYCFDASTGALAFETSEPGGDVTALAFAGEVLVAGHGSMLAVHALPGGELVGSQPLRSSIDADLAASPDGALVVHADGDNVVVRDRATLQPLGELDFWAGEMRFCDGRLIGTSGDHIVVADATNQETLERAPLLDRQTRWAAGESLSIPAEHRLAALIVHEQPAGASATDGAKDVYELQVWSLFPLRCLRRVPLGAFRSHGNTDKGGTVFGDRHIIVVGETESLAFAYR